jgi:hypothetical protein
LFAVKAGRVIFCPALPREIVVALLPPMVKVALLRVSISEVCPPTSCRDPALVRVSFVVPEEEAVRILPELVWLRIKAALLPIPPETDRGAKVLEEEPTKSPCWKLEFTIVFPDPAGVRSRLLFPLVTIAGLVPVRESAVPFAELVRIPDIPKVVTEETAPLFITIPLIVFEEVGPTNAPPEVIEEDPVVVMVPLVERLPAELMVNCPVDPTDNSCEGLLFPIPTLPLLRAVKAVVPPAARITLPVLALPNCNVCALVVPRVPLPVRYVALFPEFADMEAVGVVAAPVLLIKANRALLVAVPPKRTS